MLAEYSLNLLRGQMITQLMAGQGPAGAGGMSLTEFILGKAQPAPRRSAEDKVNDALSSLMRSDSSMLRQAAKCMLLAKALLEAGGQSIGLILANVRRMSAIAAELQCACANEAALKAEYRNLSTQIKSIIEGTRFDGVSLLDGESWAADERVTVNGDTGKISMQGGNASSDLTLYDLQNYKNAFQASDLEAGSLSATAATLGQFSGMLEGMGSSYRAKAGLLNTDAAAFERRADILDEATATARPGDEAGLKDALVNIIMRDGDAILSGVS